MLTDAQIQAVAAELAPTSPGREAIGGNPWIFVPATTQRLLDPSLPESQRAEIRMGLALALARLGLRTCAAEQLRLFRHPAQTKLFYAIVGMRDDKVSVDQRSSTCEDNLARLGQRCRSAPRLRAAMDAWRQRLASSRMFRTTAGSMVIQEADGEWSLFVDDQALALGMKDAPLGAGPFYLDGMHAPGVVQRAFTLTTNPPGQIQPRLVLLAGSAHEALDALSLRPMPEIFGSDRVELWWGPECPAWVGQEARSRMLYLLGGVIATPSPPRCFARWDAGAVQRELSDATAEQRRFHADLDHRVSTTYSDDSSAQRRRRLGAWRDARLRVLIPTSRYTTYVQHAAQDLAEELGRLGCDARIVKEPDDHTSTTLLPIMQAVADFQPDVVWFINTLRQQMGGSIPPNIPAVTWVQDAMQHLFDAKSGARLSELDFVVGHLHPELFSQFGFSRKRALYSHVLASDAKFHDGPVPPLLAERFNCDIAYVSHQSETPEQCALRIERSFDAGSDIARAIPTLVQPVIRAARRPLLQTPDLLPQLRDITAQALRDQLGHDAPHRMFAVVLHQITHPIAERALRHQMLEWSADLCERRGLRLRIYGRGWDAHPRFAPFAAGPLDHGDDLRAAYQCAKLHLHAGLGGVYHQRIMECALSGGCTLARMKPDDLHHLEWWAQNQLVRSASPDDFTQARIRGGQYLLTPVADHWQSMFVHRLYDAVGLPQQHDRRGFQVVDLDQLAHAAEQREVPLREAWLIGDPSSSGFWSPESFESAVLGVIQSDRRRQSLIRWQRDSAREHYSLRALARNTLDLIARSIGAAAPPPAFATTCPRHE